MYSGAVVVVVDGGDVVVVVSETLVVISGREVVAGSEMVVTALDVADAGKEAADESSTELPPLQPVAISPITTHRTQPRISTDLSADHLTAPE